MQKARYSIIITSYKEYSTIGKAIKQIVLPNKDILNNLEILVVTPDRKTKARATEVIKTLPNDTNIKVIKDKGLGKPMALNTAVKDATGNTLILTDGDVYLSDNALKILIDKTEKSRCDVISGHPISDDSRENMFGFYSHLFCEAANQKRLTNRYMPASGYLYSIKNWRNIFPIPKDIRAEDAYISSLVLNKNKTIDYEPSAIVHVKFPKNRKDWIKQKIRSLGGNVQLAQYGINNTRSIKEDIAMILFPFKFAKTIKEYIYLLYLYPLRLYLWFKIYKLNKSNKLGTGRWERIESSKF